jgi:hypothetical protein
MNVFLARFNGHYLGGSILIVEETKRIAFNKAKKEIDSMGLADKNKDFSMDNVEIIDCNNKQIIVIDDGNY